MAESNITKKALATAFRQLMDEYPFDKITISRICAQCNMNRKSFYYHFKDKYDLVNWIYYTDFVLPSKDRSYSEAYDWLIDICNYFEENKKFYRKVFKYDGQNSFFDYFHELLMPIIQHITDNMFEEESAKNFFITYFAESFLLAIKKWLTETSDLSAGEFVSLFRSTTLAAAYCIANRKDDNT